MTRAKLLKKPVRTFGKDSWSRTQQQRWFEVLMELLNTGFSLREAIEFSLILYPQWSSVLQPIEQSLACGHSFAKAVADLVSTDTYYLFLLAEQHGQMTKTIEHYCHYLTMRNEQVKKLRHLLEYPLVLLVILVGMIVMLTIFVFPQLNQFHQSTSHELWNILAPSFASLGGGIISILVIGYWRYCHSNRLQQVHHQCHLPIIGTLVRDYYGYYICSNLALFLDEGISTQGIIQTCHQFRHDSLLYQLSDQLKEITSRGESITRLVSQIDFIPEQLSLLFKQALSNQQLSQRVAALADQLFNRLMRKCERRLTFVQPLIYLIIAFVIVLLYLRVMLPIYQNMQVVQ